RGRDPDLRPAVDRERGREPAGDQPAGDDVPRVRDVALLGVRRVRGGVLRRLRPRGTARLPGVGTDDRHEARRALRGHVLEGVRSSGRHHGGRGDARRHGLGAGDLGMSAIATGQTTTTSSASRRFDPARLATGIVLGAWAFLFWFVLVSGRTSLYLSTRTRWLVP